MNRPDPRAILAELGIQYPTNIETVEGGADTAIWRVEQAGKIYALRVFRPDEMPRCQREVTAMTSARMGGIPVPEIIASGKSQRYPVLLLSWIPGDVLANQLLKIPDPIPLIHDFGRTQAALHQLSAPPSFDPNVWIEWAGDEEPELKKRLHQLKTPNPSLLHLDYHPRNVMSDEQGITGVIDWANAQAGDPRADFARTYSILRIEPWHPDGDSEQWVSLREQLTNAWRMGYESAGCNIEEMDIFYAWAGAVMVRDLSPRIGKPGSWLQDHHLDIVRRWRDEHKRRLGISTG